MQVICKTGDYGANIKIISENTTVEERVDNFIKKEVPQKLIDELLSASYAYHSYNLKSPVEFIKLVIENEISLTDTEIEELKQYLDTL